MKVLPSVTAHVVAGCGAHARIRFYYWPRNFVHAGSNCLCQRIIIVGYRGVPSADEDGNEICKCFRVNPGFRAMEKINLTYYRRFDIFWFVVAFYILIFSMVYFKSRIYLSLTIYYLFVDVKIELTVIMKAL